MSICIAGMHRSGTSMVARLLNICGLYLGEEKDIMKPQSDNPEGFWENNHFVEINDKILSSNGYGWDLPPVSNYIDFKKVNNEIKNDAKALIESMELNTPWGWKDPRNSLNLIFWRELLPDLKVIICLRNPLEVAMSLKKRGNSSCAFSFNLWYLYNKTIFDNIEPERVLITHYASFFINPVYEIKRLLNFTKLNIDNEKIHHACSSIASKLRHYNYSENDLINAGASEEIIGLYNSMCEKSGPVLKHYKITSSVNVENINIKIHELEELIHEYPDYAVAYNDLGVIYHQIGRKEKSLTCYEKAVSLEPENILFQKNLADYYCYELNRYEEAAKIYTRVLAQNNNDVEALLPIGHICMIQKNYNEAVYFYKRVLEIEPQNKIAFEKLEQLSKLDYSNDYPLEKMEKDCIDINIENASNNEYSVKVTQFNEIKLMDFKNDVTEKNNLILKTGMTSIIIPVFNKIEYTKKCLEAIRKNTPAEKYEIIVIDNASTDGTNDFLKLQGNGIKLITNTQNMGFTFACNQGAKIATGEFVLFLNNDTEPQTGWLESMVELMQSDNMIGITGSKLIYPDGRLQEAGGIVFSDGSGWNYGRFDDPFKPQYNYVREVDYVSGASLMIRHPLLKKLNYFDERYSPGYYEDTDLCFGARSLGYKVMYCPFSIVIHHEGITSGTDIKSGMKKFQVINRKKFINKWKEDLKKQYLPDSKNVINASERNTKGNIIIIDPFLPKFDRASGSLRLYSMIKILKEHNYHITFIARNGRGQKQYERILNFIGIEVYATDPERLKKLGINFDAKPINIAEILTIRHYDIAILSFYEIAVQYLDIIRIYSPETKILIDTVDIHFVREIRMAEVMNDKTLFRKAHKTKNEELSIYRKADAIITVTDKDWEHVSGYLPGMKHFVIPNIHEISEETIENTSRKGLIFVGNFNHPPNADAILFFINDIFPIIKKKINDVTFTIVGNNPPEEILKLHNNKDILVTGYVPSTTPYLQSARVSVAPLRYGAGMKGKIGEAMSHGLPVVTTSIGAEGMGIVNGENALVADTPDEFAEQVYQLYTDDNKWIKISESGKNLIKDNYSKEKVGEIITRILDELIEKKTYSVSFIDEKKITNELTSIIILTFNEIKYTKKCFESIKTYTPESHEIIFVDNGSTDGTVKWLRQLVNENKNIKLIENKTNLGFAKGCNQGINMASGEYILLLNNDVVVTKGWLSGMLDCIKREESIGIVGPMTNNISGIQRVIDYENINLENLFDYAESFMEKNKYRRIPVRRVAGFCMLFKYELVKDIGMLDESFGSGNYEDDDFCLRAILSGYRNYIAGDVFIYHYGSRSFKGNGIDYRKAIEKNQKIFKKKWNIIDSSSLSGVNLALIKCLEKADIYRQKGRYEDSVREYIKAIQINPDDVKSYYAFAEMLVAEKKYQDALDVLKQSPALEEDLNLILLKALCFEGLELIPEAEECIDKILFYDKSNVYALNLKGQIAYKKGNVIESEKIFRHITELNPSYGEPFTNLGILRWSEGKYEEALNLTEKGFILSPNNNDIASIYHSIVSALGKYSRSEKVMKEAKALYPNSRKITFLLIDVLIKQNKNVEALNYIQESITSFGKDDGIIEAALEVRKRIDEASQDNDLTPSKKLQKTVKTLSLCMIVKNEENTLPDCLNSIRNIVDEIIIVDTGSTDRTKDIAKIYGAKIYDFKWTNDFSEARNYSLSKANCDWILILDADEIISPIDHDRLKELINKKQNVAYSITTRNYVNVFNLAGWTSNGSIYSKEEKGKGWFPSTKVRLFPNKKGIKFHNKVHELVEPSLKEIGIQIKNCDVAIHHYGKLNDDHVIEKGKDYYKLGIQKIENTTDPKALYELAIQAGELDRHREAVELWKKLLQTTSSLSDNILLKAYINMGHAYFHLGMYKEAYDVSKKAYLISPDSQDAIMNYSLSEVWIGEAEKAITLIRTLLEKKPDFPQAIGLLGIAYMIKGDEEKAYKYLEKIKKKGFNCSKFIYDHAKILTSTGKRECAIILIRKAIEMNLLDEQLRDIYEEDIILKG